MRVLNGASVEKRATNVAGALERAGFGISEIGDVEDIGRDDVDHSEVRYAPGDEAAAALVGRHLTTGATLVEDVDVDAGTIVLVAGRDFTTVTAAALPAVPGEPPTTAAPSTTTTTAPPTTPTTGDPVGRAPEDPPPGVSCG